MTYGQGGPRRGPGGAREPQDPQHPQGTYGPPPEPYGPAPGGPLAATPDWASLAEAASRARRRRLLGIGGAALAIVAVGAAVAYAIVSADGSGGSPDTAKPSGLPATAELPGGPTAADPTFSSVAPPPPPDPEEFISDAKKDTAPLSVEGLFPGRKLTMAGRVYEKGPLHRTDDCASAVQAPLAAVLEANGCRQLLRATYTRDGAAVTVGVAVLDTRDQARRVKTGKPRGSSIRPLSGGGVPDFCRATVCRNTGNSTGRYAYFTLSGHLDGRKVTLADTEVLRTGDDLAEFTFRQIRRRGEAQASAAVNSP